MTRPPYWTEAEVAAVRPSARAMVAAVADAFRQNRAGDAALVPKVGVYPRSGGLFHAMPAGLPDLIVVKWLTIGAGGEDEGGGRIRATVIATDPRSGRTIAILEAELLTAWRTAAVSALAVELLGPGGAARLGIVGCGLQSRVHVELFAELGLMSGVVLFSRSERSAAALAVLSRDRGLEARVAATWTEVVEEADILLTALPFVRDTPRFIELSSLKPGGLAIGVDLALGWDLSTPVFDLVVTDERTHTEAMLGTGLLLMPGAIDLDLADLLEPATQGRRRDRERIAFVPPGVALADAALARLLLVEQGLMPRTS